MAKKNVRDEPPKTQVTENAQLSDIVFILDKMELLLQAISDIDKNGRYKTVSADKKHRNSFLKIDRYASMFENFLKNFWSQLKDPTRFGILSVKENALDNPEVRQAIEDLAAGRKSDAVEEFLKKYEIVPRSKENQSINHQNQEEMAKKTETQQQAAPETAQQPKYRYNESMINWEELKKYGLSREYLQERGLLDQMLRGYKTNQVVPISMNFGSAVLRTDARLSLQQSVEGPIVLGIHGIRQKPELDRPYFGHIFSEEDKKNLLETGNMGRVVELKGRGGEYIPSFVSIDKLTNEVVAMRAENVFIPKEIKGVKLTEQEQNDLREGKKVFIEGMISNNGKEFDAHIQINAERRGIEYIFDNDKLFNRQSLGGVELTKQQVEDLNAGRAIFVAVNCGALPRELAASLFFGHEKGAFTGADTAKTGYFDMAKGGTLFLDEIGTMSYEIQSMLLRVLQENTYTPIGSDKERVADVRIVTATNENLQLAIKEGRFREDLYHRLCEFEIRQPSLAECPEDIIPLAEFFRERHSKELKRETQGFTENAKRRMLTYSWPGNVRDLQNRIKRAVLIAETPMLDMEGLDIEIRQSGDTHSPVIQPLKDESLEKMKIINALKACNGHREQAAALLNINPATLYRKMKKYGVK